MKVKTLIKVVAICAGGLLLTACAHKRPDDESAINQANAAYGVNGSDAGEAHGLGNGTNFSDQAGGGSLLSHRVYYFDFDSNVVRDGDKPAIDANAHYLMNHPHMAVSVQGNTDPRGSREYNIGLGERRAKAVEAILLSDGVNAEQIHIVSFGAEKLASFGRTEADYQLDRRVVLVYR